MKNENKLKLAKKNKEREKLKAEEVETLSKYSKTRAEELNDIKRSIEGLAEALQVSVEFPDIDPLLKKLETLEQLPDSFKDIKSLSLAISNKLEKFVESNGRKDIVTVRGFNEYNAKFDKLVQDTEATNEKFADLNEYLNQLTQTLKQGQKPEEYKPVRIVVGGDGTRLNFLTQFPSSRGGGGASGGSSSVGLTDAELRASPVPVSGTFYQVTQPVSAASLPLPSGASTSAKQDSVISQLGLTPLVNYNYIDVQQTDADTETFVFKTGGAGGSTVMTIVINYTDSTKANIDNVSWS